MNHLSTAEVARRTAIAAREDLSRGEQAGRVGIGVDGWCRFARARGLPQRTGRCGIRVVPCVVCGEAIYRYVARRDGSRTYIDPAIWHDCPRIGLVTLDYGGRGTSLAPPTREEVVGDDDE